MALTPTVFSYTFSQFLRENEKAQWQQKALLRKELRDLRRGEHTSSTPVENCCDTTGNVTSQSVLHFHIMDSSCFSGSWGKKRSEVPLTPLWIPFPSEHFNGLPNLQVSCFDALSHSLIKFCLIIVFALLRFSWQCCSASLLLGPRNFVNQKGFLHSIMPRGK